MKSLVTAVQIFYYVKFRRILEIPLLAMLVRYSAGGPFCCYFFGWEDYMPELREIGLDPAVQGVPVKKKLSVPQKP